MSTNKKTLDVVSIEDAKCKVSDIKVVGNGNTFQLLSKASSVEQGWMKSTKAMDVGNGVVVQVTTQNGDNVAEALTYVPGVKIVDDDNGGRKLVSLWADLDIGDCDPCECDPCDYPCDSECKCADHD